MREISLFVVVLALEMHAKIASAANSGKRESDKSRPEPPKRRRHASAGAKIM